MGSMGLPCARIISTLNVEEEALKAFYFSLLNDASVEDYIAIEDIHFSSSKIERVFLSHLLAIAELALERCSLSKVPGVCQILRSL